MIWVEKVAVFIWSWDVEFVVFDLIVVELEVVDLLDELGGTTI